jgi:hypothetical protein
VKKRVSAKPAHSADGATVRVSVSIPADDYADLKRAARSKRVSVAWVVRDAVHEYFRNQEPLLRA